VYLAKKYHATDSDLAILKASLSDGQLFLAFLEQGSFGCPRCCART